MTNIKLKKKSSIDVNKFSELQIAGKIHYNKIKSLLIIFV